MRVLQLEPDIIITYVAEFLSSCEGYIKTILILPQAIRPNIKFYLFISISAPIYIPCLPHVSTPHTFSSCIYHKLQTLELFQFHHAN
jgi:hypothetical protein